jgi:hypothetical protein
VEPVRRSQIRGYGTSAPMAEWVALSGFGSTHPLLMLASRHRGRAPARHCRRRFEQGLTRPFRSPPQHVRSDYIQPCRTDSRFPSQYDRGRTGQSGKPTDDRRKRRCRDRPAADRSWVAAADRRGNPAAHLRRGRCGRSSRADSRRRARPSASDRGSARAFQRRSNCEARASYRGDCRARC